MESKMLTMQEVVDYIDDEYDRIISRPTPYNWANNGVNGHKLSTVTRVGVLYTTKEWVDEFLSCVYG